MRSAREKWNNIYASQSWEGAQPTEVLQWYQHLLPASGIALDLACGLGVDSLFFAQRGLSVWSWDISSIAITQLRRVAEQLQLDISTQERDVIATPPEPDSVDVLLVSHFLERRLIPALIAAVKPGGLLFYQTYTMEKVNPVGPSHPDYLLARNELLHLFTGLSLCAYREDAVVGNIEQGWRNQAMLVAQKN